MQCCFMVWVARQCIGFIKKLLYVFETCYKCCKLSSTVTAMLHHLTLVKTQADADTHRGPSSVLDRWLPHSAARFQTFTPGHHPVAFSCSADTHRMSAWLTDVRKGLRWLCKSRMNQDRTGGQAHHAQQLRQRSLGWILGEWNRHDCQRCERDGWQLSVSLFRSLTGLVKVHGGCDIGVIGSPPLGEGVREKEVAQTTRHNGQ